MPRQSLDFDNNIYGLDDETQDEIETSEYYGLHVVKDLSLTGDEEDGEY